MEILYSKDGTPLLMSSANLFGDTVNDLDIKDSLRKRDILNPFDVSQQNCIIIGEDKILKWGRDNAFPLKANEIISSTSVLNTGLKFLRELTVGQGIYPCKINGYDEKGNEKLFPVTDKAVLDIVNSRMVRRYLEKISRDYFKLGCGNVELIPNSTGNRIVGLNVLNPLYWRFTTPNEYGACKCVISPNWSERYRFPDDVKKLDVLMDYSPELEAQWRYIKDGYKKPFCYAIRDSWSNNDIYGEPIWLPAYILGWVDIAHMVPQFLKKAYKNQITWKWHIQIPYSFWDKKFPVSEYGGNSDQRKRDIQKYMDSIENNLCGVENAEKPLFSNYAINEANGKVEEEWKITALDNKYKGGDNLVTSAAANSEILFSLMVNPNVLGAGMPGGTYAGNQGGSNIREAFLVNIANAWIDRQNLLDPVYLMLKSYGIDDVQLRFRNTILTTLDTGAGTQKTLS